MANLLTSHIAAVTGAGSGIGRAIALGFAREGAQVVALDINGETAAKTAAEIEADGGKAASYIARRHQARRLRADRQESRSGGRPRLDPRQQCRHQPAQSLRRRS